MQRIGVLITGRLLVVEIINREFGERRPSLIVMPSGAKPIEVFISCRLKEPLRSEPQIAST
jgi:hypothetical protein